MWIYQWYVIMIFIYRIYRRFQMTKKMTKELCEERKIMYSDLIIVLFFHFYSFIYSRFFNFIVITDIWCKLISDYSVRFIIFHVDCESWTASNFVSINEIVLPDRDKDMAILWDSNLIYYFKINCILDR